MQSFKSYVKETNPRYKRLEENHLFSGVHELNNIDDELIQIRAKLVTAKQDSKDIRYDEICDLIDQLLALQTMINRQTGDKDTVYDDIMINYIRQTYYDICERAKILVGE